MITRTPFSTRISLLVSAVQYYASLFTKMKNLFLDSCVFIPLIVLDLRDRRIIEVVFNKNVISYWITSWHKSRSLISLVVSCSNRSESGSGTGHIQLERDGDGRARGCEQDGASKVTLMAAVIRPELAASTRHTDLYLII